MSFHQKNPAHFFWKGQDNFGLVLSEFLCEFKPKNRGGVDWNVSDCVTEIDNTSAQGATQTRVLQGLV